MTTQQRGVITFSVMAATLMQTLDSTITNVALPTMQGSLSASPEQITWVLTSYIVASAIAMAPTGALARRFGRKRMFLISVSGFIVASVLCGLAANLNQIVAFRLLQGMFGAALVPLSQLVLLDAYPREQHGSAMAMWGVGVMVGPILGPTLGGWLTDHYDWRWVFFINLPTGILALIGLSSALPASQPDRGMRFDWLGFLLLSGAIASLQLMLDRGQAHDWFGSPEIVIEATLGALLFYLFVVQTTTARAPFLRPQLFVDRNFAAGLVMIFVVGIVMFATAALMPQFLQNLKGYPVVTTGLVVAPRGFGVMLSMVLAGRIVRYVDPRLIIMAGMGVTTLTLWQTAGFTLDVPAATVVWNGVVQGVGLGMVFVPINALAYATLAPADRGDATALFSLMRNLGSSVGIALTFALLARGTQQAHSVLVQQVTPFNAALAQYVNADGGLVSSAGLAMIEAEVNRQAALISMLGDFRLMAFAVLLAMPMVLLFRKPVLESRGPAIDSAAAMLD